MKTRTMLLAALFLYACTPTDSEPTGDDDVQPPGVDAGPDTPETGQRCGLPGDDPCAEGTTCYDFGHFGGLQCQNECGDDAECATGCCEQGVCSPTEFCGIGGVYPEATCYSLSACGHGSESTCNTNMGQCLENLTSDQLHTWIDGMNECFENTTCSDFYSCYLTVPWC